MAGDTWKRRSMARWLAGDGIEIGALHNPLHLPEGARVRYVDRASTAELYSHYPDQGDLVPISFIGDACDLSALEADSLDFVVANHVVEHLQDPIRGLREMARVLRPGGLLYLAIPDQRATFDRRRPATSIAHLVDEYHQGTEATRRAHLTEYVELAERGEPGQATARESVAERVDVLLETDYSIHYHVFRPDTFSELLSAAQREAATEFELVAFEGCDAPQDDEFIFLLGKSVAPQPRATPPLVPGVHMPPLPEPSGPELLASLRERGWRRLRRTLYQRSG